MAQVQAGKDDAAEKGKNEVDTELSLFRRTSSLLLALERTSMKGIVTAQTKSPVGR